MNFKGLSGRLSGIMPGVYAVTWRTKQAGVFQTNFQDVLLPRARRRRLTKDEQLQASALSAKRTRTWELFRDVINGVNANAPVPKAGDQIVEADGTMWIMRFVNVQLDGGVYGCICEQGVGL